MRYPIQLMTAFMVLMVSVLSGQSFEGIVSLKVSTFPDNVTKMTIKDDKTLMEIQIDSTQAIKVIKDRGAETTTILRSKNDLKYGFRTNAYYGEDEHYMTSNAAASQVEINVTDQEKYFGKYKCVKVNLNSPKAIAVAWITKEHGWHLSTWVPSFLGEGSDPNLYLLRELADHEGLIMYYSESLKSDNVENTFEVTVEEKEISIDAFAVDPGFVVLDEDGMKRLILQSLSDPMKKQQLDEFQQIFGNK